MEHELKKRNWLSFILLTAIFLICASLRLYSYPAGCFVAAVVLLIPLLNALAVLKLYFNLSEDEREEICWILYTHPYQFCAECVAVWLGTLWYCHPYLMGVAALTLCIVLWKLHNERNL